LLEADLRSALRKHRCGETWHLGRGGSRRMPALLERYALQNRPIDGPSAPPRPEEWNTAEPLELRFDDTI